MRARHCALATFLLIGPWQCTALHAHAASHLCGRSCPYDGAPPLRLLRPRARWPLLAAEMPRCCDEAIHSCSAAAYRRRAVAVRMMMSPEVLERSIRPILVTVALSTAAMVPTSVGAFAPGDRPMKKLWRRGFTGFAFAVFVSSWIFSGTYAFLSVFALFAVIAQNEYYNMARRNGVNPTWKLGLLGSVLMYVAAASPSAVLRDAVFPLTGCGSIVYLLLRPGFEQSYSNVFPWFDRKTPPTTYDDVATTFFGIFLFGYMPSFWIRLRCIAPMHPSAALSLVAAPAMRSRWPLAAIERCGADVFTHGAIVQWWTMLGIVFSDVAAYFVGKKLGRTPLIWVSPKKTWEGLYGGMAAAMGTMVAAALLMRWPVPLASGAAYGLILSLMGLVGDLTVSLLKRSAGVKDTGTIMPGHGGLLDRLDSYLLVAAPAFFIFTALRHVQ